MEKSILQTDFQLVDNFISEFLLNSFEKIKPNTTIDLDMNISFSIVNVDEKNLTGQIELKYDINLKDLSKEKDKTKIGKILITMNAIFKQNTTIPVPEFVEKLKFEGGNTLAHLCRSYISSATALSGIPTINIPLINFDEFFKSVNLKH